ncbi:MAG TPA: O-antigen ligase family protein [Pseudolabrys sp.]|nr:O-antigen ligase family protein [Pseudolabrys sp.]
MAIASGIHLERFAKAANCLAIAVAVSLPWSTSATSILLVLWLIALIPTLDWSALRGQLTSAAGGLPVVLFLLGALGMLWADVAWHDRLGGLDGFVRLLTIPLLMTQFSRSDGGRRVLIGFLASCVVLLIASFVLILWPQLHPRRATLEGVPVKSYIVQGLEFAMCAAAVLEIARVKAAARQWKYAAAFAALGLAFLADVFFVNTGRTALVIIPALVVIFGIWRSGWKGLIGASVATAALASIVWFASPSVRDKVTAIYTETLKYERQNDISSSGLRIEFWKKSLRFIVSAPVFGHGTGSIRAQFEQAETGEGPSAIVATNPHNQTFAVGIQLGLAGMAVLWAMWISQLLLCRGAGLVAWIGLVVVTSNIVGSLFNSFIFDFTEGWIYVFGIGVAAGMVRRSPDAGARAALGP